MATPPAEFTELKNRLKGIWMAGDFGQIARSYEPAAAEFVARLKLKPGMRVLDVACGTGNQSIPGARTGASVTGVDIATNLIEQAKLRAQGENLPIEFVEGDAESLQYPDGHFDVVLSMFGAMFAPRPEVAASEMLRVCKPHGTIAMANWTASGFSGKLFETTAKHVPPPPSVAPPILWGEECVVRERLGAGVEIQTEKREIVFEFPLSPAGVVDLFRTYFGPVKTAFARLDEAGQRAMANDLANLWAKYNEGDESNTRVRAEYLEVHARKGAA